jgi:hypothetical protein
VKQRGGKWERGVASREGSRVLYCEMVLVHGAPAMDSIGCRGQLCGAALCAESREHVCCVGGGLVWLWHEWVQRGCDRNSAPRGLVSATWGRARVASCLRLGAMPVCVIGGAGGGLCARERDSCAACSGRPGDVDLARSRRGVWWVSPASASGNWFVGSWQAWRRGDRAGDGWWRADHAGMPTVAMVTARAAWGADAGSLRGGASARVSAGWRSSTGGRWRRLVEYQRERVLAGRVCLGLPLSVDSKPKTTKGRGL